MAKLQQVIRECTKPIEHSPKITDQPDFSIFIEPVNGLDVVGVKHEESDTEYPTVTVKVSSTDSTVIVQVSCVGKHEFSERIGTVHHKMLVCVARVNSIAIKRTRLKWSVWENQLAQLSLAC